MKLLRDGTRPFEPVISSKHTQRLPSFIVLFHLMQMVKLIHLPALEECADRGRQTGFKFYFHHLFLFKKDINECEKAEGEAWLGIWQVTAVGLKFKRIIWLSYIERPLTNAGEPLITLFEMKRK